MPLSGIDVSYAQATTPSLAGRAFCFVRAGYGSASVDSKWAYHSGNVRAAGKVLGAYWFWYLDQDNAKAVATFLATAGHADLLALDLEGTAHDTTAGHDQARDFIARVHAAGRKIGLYHSSSGFPKLGQDFDWIANWGSSTTPPAGAEFWQYRGSPLDLDYFEGDMTALNALIGSTSGTIIGGLEVGFPVVLTGPVADVTFAAGVDTYRVRDSLKQAAGSAATRRGYGAKHVGGSSGWLINLSGTSGVSEAYFVYAANATAVPVTLPPATDDTPFKQADIDAAVAAATAALNARLSGVKTKVAAAAADIAND